MVSGTERGVVTADTTIRRKGGSFIIYAANMCFNFLFSLCFIFLLRLHTANTENPCAKNFTRIGDNCYLIAIEHPGVNWKTANNLCRSYGAQLAELETLNEHNDIVAYLLNHHNLNDYDNFWLGGLNPGLLWIWSSSARPVNTNVNLTSIHNGSAANGGGASTMKINNTKGPSNNTTTSSPKPSKQDHNELEIEGTGRCLGLVYARDKHNYKFYGVECTSRQHFLCELPQDRIKKEISRIAKGLFPWWIQEDVIECDRGLVTYYYRYLYISPNITHITLIRAVFARELLRMRRTMFIYLIYSHLLFARANVEFILYSLQTTLIGRKMDKNYFAVYARCRSHSQFPNRKQ